MGQCEMVVCVFE